MASKEISEIFIENLKQLLNENNMTYAVFAKKIGVGASTVSMWMRGTNTPRMEVLNRIAELFDIDVVDLYFDRSKKQEHLNKVRAAMGLPSSDIMEKESLTFFQNKDLLDSINKLNEEGQQKVKEYADDLAENSKYRKDISDET